LLYTNPFKDYFLEFKAGPVTIAELHKMTGREYWVESLGTEDEKMIQRFIAVREILYNSLKGREGEYVPISADLMSFWDELPDFTVLDHPRNVGLIIDNEVMSAGELFTMIASSSRKVKTFGQSTYGMIDTGAQRMILSPCEKIYLQYSMARFSWVPDLLVDEAGIAPDFLIDRSVPDYKWVEYVTEIMGQWITEPEPRRRRGRF
jgi:hypothetical protein